MSRASQTYRPNRRNTIKLFNRIAKNKLALVKANEDTSIFGRGMTYQQPNGVIRYVEPAQWVKL